MFNFIFYEIKNLINIRMFVNNNLFNFENRFQDVEMEVENKLAILQAKFATDTFAMEESKESIYSMLKTFVKFRFKLM